MLNKIICRYLGLSVISLAFAACTPAIVQRSVNKTVPEVYGSSRDTANIAKISWKAFFADPYLNALIDTALKNNQELNMTLQEIEISRNEVRARRGEYLPFIGLRGGAAVEKVGRYTHQGATDATTDLEPGKKMPDPLQDYLVGAFASWEVDVWHKLRNAKNSAAMKYLATMEGKNFMVTQLVGEIATSYYELIALDDQLKILQRNVEVQKDALRIVTLQKNAARVTELAVRKFEAEVLKNQSRQYYIQQNIIEIENRINFLMGQYPQPIARSADGFTPLTLEDIHVGIPAQLLERRPDVRQAELNLAAAELDVKVAKGNFYPTLGLSAGVGLHALSPRYLIKAPESLLYSLAGDLTAPLINRHAIKAMYYSANAKQIQSVYNYERTVLNAYMEVANQIARIKNLNRSFELKEKEVQTLLESINVSISLFSSARADYMEVLMTQRDALDARFELIETKKEQMNAIVDIYRALGGGWN